MSDTEPAEFVCEGCGKSSRPLLRILGHPTEEAWALVDAGKAVIKGCLIDPTDTCDHECRFCERGTYWPRER